MVLCFKICLNFHGFDSSGSLQDEKFAKVSQEENRADGSKLMHQPVHGKPGGSLLTLGYDAQATQMYMNKSMERC